MRLRSLVPASTLALSALLSLAAFTAGIAQARAEPVPACGQRGRVSFDKDTTLSDARGRTLARFSGGESAVKFLAPPAQGSDMARIETGTGRGSFRLSGFVKASELPLFTSHALPIVGNHVWLAAGTRVVAAGLSAGKVKIDKQVTSPFNQRFSVVAECSALTFAPPTPAGFSMPGNARVYLMKISSLDLYADAAPGSAAVATLARSPPSHSVRFFSTEQRAGYVRVRYQGEINVDAWAKSSDLQALPRGETSDPPPESYRMSSPPQLQLEKLPRIVQTTRELPLRVAARDADAPVGVIEADTEVYVMDTVAGWAKVLPKSLHILPAGELSFWVKASDLGL